MLKALVTASRRSARAEAGFTLVELLVAMAAGIVVLGALYTLLDVTLHQTTLTFSRVDATQHARLALQTLEDELHSACVADSLSPIQAGSDGSTLIFVSQYASSASNANAISPTPVEHKVTYDAANGTLTDTSYAATGGAGPNWTFSSTPQSTQTLLSHVTLQSGNPPVFQYFDYSIPTNGGTPYTAPGGQDIEMIQDGVNAVPYTANVVPPAQPLATPLSGSDAGGAVEVLIKLEAQPAGGDHVNTNEAADAVTDQVSLRLTQPVNHVESGVTFGPCE
jgi:prepilin-type N-terminal cleavage/methylation domain-containing protein